MKKLSFILITLLALSAIKSYGQLNPKEKGLEAITMEAIQSQLEFLASDWTEGRGTGTKGIYLAGDYVASMMKYASIEPAGDVQRRFRGRRMPARGMQAAPSRSYFQNFTLLEQLPGGESSLTLTNPNGRFVFKEGIDFMIRGGNGSGEIGGPLVFIGYGIKNDDLGIDDFGGTDLKGKVVVRLAGYPGINDPESEMYKKINKDRMVAFRMNRTKNSAIEDKGVAAIIDIDLNRDITSNMGVFKDDMNKSPNEGRSPGNWTRMSLEENDAGPGRVTLTVTPKVANAIFGNYDVEGFEKKAAVGGSKFKPFNFEGVRAGISIDMPVRRIKVRNVVAMIEGEKNDEFVVVGAHMDHMGMFNGRIWNGADDNASGTVGVMTIAKAFAAAGVKPERTVLFCSWTGEEKGLLGSEYFTRNPSVGSIDQVKFYLNFDMISRDAANDTAKVNVGVTYNKDYPALEEISKKNEEEFGLKMNFNYRAQDHPTGGSDYTAFTNNNVPIIAVMAAMHPEYHTDADHVNLVNWDKMLEIIKLGFLNLWDIANSDF